MKAKRTHVEPKENHLTLESDRTVRVRLFGAVELENTWGTVRENPSKRAQPWLLLKYLMVNAQKEVDTEDLFRDLWPSTGDRAKDENAIRVRLNRLREALAPIRLGTAKGLVAYDRGKYGFNPEYHLETDADAFLELKRQAEQLPLEDPVGLHLFADALELFRGPYMEHTDSFPWLEETRAAYARALSAMARSTLARSKAQKVDEVLPLLCQRTAEIIPGDRELHLELIAYLVDRELEAQRTLHISRLLNSGEADWLAELEKQESVRSAPAAERSEPPAIPVDRSAASADDDHAVYVRLFGTLELENKQGVVRESVTPRQLSWLLLKYLLTDPQRKVGLDELLATIWPPAKEKFDDENAARVRLRRIREALAPIGLNGTTGLVAFSDGKYFLNLKYTLQTDVDAFLQMKSRAEQVPLEDHAGLEFCRAALEVFRGPFLENTESAPWLEKWRSLYSSALSALAANALQRSNVLGSSEVISLLCQRTAAILPGDEALHRAIIHYLVEQKQEDELMRYLYRLASSGKAEWLNTVCNKTNYRSIEVAQERHTE